MTIDKMTGKEIEGLSLEELEAQTGERLPDREEMSLVNANVYAPVNTAIALNLFSDHSTATANAIQVNDVQQGNFGQNDFGQNGMQYGHEQYGHDSGGNMQYGYDEQANVNYAAPTNTAVAANVGSDYSMASANAIQVNDVQQGTFGQNDFMDDYRY